MSSLPASHAIKELNETSRYCPSSRLKLSEDESELRKNEWRRLFDGVRNNQPEYVTEWKEGAYSPSLQKRVLRQMFGTDGDTLRRAGWGAMYFGPLTRAAIERFGIKLGKALYYRHNNHLFEGDIYLKHVTVIGRDTDRRYLEAILPFAPIPVLPERNRKSIADQFTYRYNNNAEVGIVHAIIEFNPQLIYHILAVGPKISEEVRAANPLRGAVMHHCVLKSCGPALNSYY